MPPDTTLWDRITAHGIERPRQVAVQDGARAWTYDELVARANAVGALLDDAHAGERVACLLSHGADMVAGVLGVLAGGRAYVPLDATHPIERSSFVLSDSGARTLLCDAANLELAHRLGGDVRVVRIEDAPAGRSPARRPAPSDLAYCLYTSGSTGRPKGVLQRHSNVVHLLDGYSRRLEVSPSDVVTLLSTFAFDAAVVDVFSTLLAGATLVPYDLRSRGLLGLTQMLAERRVTIYHSTPTVWREVSTASLPPTIRAVVLGGEEVRPDDVTRLRAVCPSAILVNGYGMTECSWALLNIVRPGDVIDRATVALGTPIDGVRVTLKTSFGVQRTLNAVGTISIESPYVALGYHQRPEENAAAFPAPGTYVTTDLGRLLAGGAIEFAGRQAHHVKLRGFRIDLREVEAVLATHADVHKAAVAVHDGVRGPELVGYVVGRSAAPDTASIREHLAKTLPDYMVPAVVVPLAALPTGATGKLDRAALPAPDQSAFKRGTYVAPRTDTETKLAAVWSQLLALERIGIHDDFFTIGGNSLLTIRLVANIEHALGITVPVRDVFDHATIAELASYIDTRGTSALQTRPRYVPTTVTDARATSSQEYFWYLDRQDHDPNSYCAIRVIVLHGELDTARFAQSFRELTAHHSVLRTAYSERNGELWQHVRPVEDVPIELESHDAAEADSRAEIERHAAALLAKGYDLATAEGLLRARLLRLAPDRHAYIQSAHHIIFDGPSGAAFQRTLLQGYARLVAGEAHAHPPLPLRYIDYADARERWRATPSGHAHEAWWKDYVRDAPAVELPGDVPRAAIDARRAAAPRGVTADLSYAPQPFPLPADVYAKVNEAARTLRTTPYVIYMAALALLLRERSGQDHVAIQSTYSPRGEDAALAEIIGCMTTWTLMRMNLANATGLPDAITAARDAIANVQDHGAPDDYYGIVPHDLRRVVLNYLPGAPGGAATTFGGVRPEVLPWPFPVWKRTWDLHLTLNDNGTGAYLFWTGYSELFRRETLAALRDRYIEILARAQG